MCEEVPYKPKYKAKFSFPLRFLQKKKPPENVKGGTKILETSQSIDIKNKKICNERMKVTFRRVHVTIVAVEKQQVFRNLVPPGWWLCVRLTTLTCKKLIVTKPYKGGQGPPRAVASSKKK